jgi:hypothetical protein
MQDGDWFLYGGETTAEYTKGKLYIQLNGVVVEDTDPTHIAAAMADLLAMSGTGVYIPSAQNFIDNLTTNNLSVRSSTAGGGIVEMLREAEVGLKISSEQENGTGKPGTEVLRAYTDNSDNFNTGDVVIGKYKGSPYFDSNSGMYWDDRNNAIQITGRLRGSTDYRTGLKQEYTTTITNKKYKHITQSISIRLSGSSWIGYRYNAYEEISNNFVRLERRVTGASQTIVESVIETLPYPSWKNYSIASGVFAGVTTSDIIYVTMDGTIITTFPFTNSYSNPRVWTNYEVYGSTAFLILNLANSTGLQPIKRWRINISLNFQPWLPMDDGVSVDVATAVFLDRRHSYVIGSGNPFVYDSWENKIYIVGNIPVYTSKGPPRYVGDAMLSVLQDVGDYLIVATYPGISKIQSNPLYITSGTPDHVSMACHFGDEVFVGVQTGTTTVLTLYSIGRSGYGFYDMNPT